MTTRLTSGQWSYLSGVGLALVGLGLVFSRMKPAQRISPSKVGQLVALLNSEQPYARRYAARHLGMKGETAVDAVPALNKTLQDQDRGARQNAAWALALIQGPEAKDIVPTLIKILEDPANHDPRTRKKYIQALAHIGPEAWEALPLLHQVEQDEDEGVRTEVIEALKAIEWQ